MYVEYNREQNRIQKAIVLIAIFMIKMKTSFCLRTPIILRPHSIRLFSSSSKEASIAPSGIRTKPNDTIDLHTIEKSELIKIVVSQGHSSYRASQLLHWVREKGICSFDEMKNIPKSLRSYLSENAAIGTLEVVASQVSRDGTLKRAYRLKDGQIIESVMMSYEDGRKTACISSQAGCAMGCVFCATGQMGFSRQLSSNEIFEQVSIFSSLLKSHGERLSNVVFMGMGEPLANYSNVMHAVRRIISELGIGARRITISTVGIVPNIYKLMNEKEEVKLAISLHCADDQERSALLPANKRYGGLDPLMKAVKEYTDSTKRRITFQWAIIEGKNDSITEASKLGSMIRSYKVRLDLVHVNLIPLNPTGGYGGTPSGRKRVKEFQKCLKEKFSIQATPRTRRGIDIDAGCGQLKSIIEKKIHETNTVKKPTTFLNNYST